MSTILRALKKLEHDKASAKPDKTDLDLEFLNSPPLEQRRSPIVVLLLVGLLLASGSVGTYLFMTRSTTIPVPAPASAPAAPQARQSVLRPASSAVRGTPPLANRSSAAMPPTVSAPLVAEQPKPAPTTNPVTAQKTAMKTPSESLTRQIPAISRQHAPQATKAPKQPDQFSPHPSLTVNGIALSDGERRKAIVNGMSVAVGSVIEGVRVEDILSNRVRFSHGGETFEVTVGNTGP